MTDYFKKKGTYSNISLKNSDDQHFGSGWSVERRGDKYYLSYISGALIGKSKTHEISKYDFEAAKRGEIDLDGLCAKYEIF